MNERVRDAQREREVWGDRLSESLDEARQARALCLQELNPEGAREWGLLAHLLDRLFDEWQRPLPEETADARRYVRRGDCTAEELRLVADAERAIESARKAAHALVDTDLFAEVVAEFGRRLAACTPIRTCVACGDVAEAEGHDLPTGERACHECYQFGRWVMLQENGRPCHCSDGYEMHRIATNWRLNGIAPVATKPVREGHEWVRCPARCRGGVVIIEAQLTPCTVCHGIGAIRATEAAGLNALADALVGDLVPAAAVDPEDVAELPVPVPVTAADLADLESITNHGERTTWQEA